MFQNLVVFNSESAYYFFKDKNFRKCVIKSNSAICDSISLSIVFRLIGLKHKRLHGPDLFESYLKDNSAKRIVILGGSEVAHCSIKKKYKLKDALFISKKIDLENMETDIELIKRFKPMTIFICLGLRKQETFIYHLLKLKGETDQLELIAGVGAAVDFASDSKERAGMIYRVLGLEWLPRLIREPRMFPRIVRSLLGCFLVLFNFQSFKKEMDKFLVNLDV